MTSRALPRRCNKYSQLCEHRCQGDNCENDSAKGQYPLGQGVCDFERGSSSTRKGIGLTSHPKSPLQTCSAVGRTPWLLRGRAESTPMRFSGRHSTSACRRTIRDIHRYSSDRLSRNMRGPTISASLLITKTLAFPCRPYRARSIFRFSCP